MLKVKKILLALSFIVSFFVLPIHGEHVTNYAHHLWGNPNYELMDAKMGLAFYLDKSSIVSKNDKTYMAVNIVSVDADNNYTYRNTTTFHFNYAKDPRTNRLLRWGTVAVKVGNNPWYVRSLNFSSSANDMVVLPTALRLFYLVKGYDYSET